MCATHVWSRPVQIPTGFDIPTGLNDRGSIALGDYPRTMLCEHIIRGCLRWGCVLGRDVIMVS